MIQIRQGMQVGAAFYPEPSIFSLVALTLRDQAAGKFLTPGNL
jgi:hypothetical protein